ncbi:MAG: MgtC/SapB family protein [Nitrosomonas sp.]|uniref:MgtC/SapB family protein n=1 Tax=Nitrosomonas sp. TaxID=42353 RepID=UPI001DFDEC76|nr:MgtC/SapB family protein [Nitrosomonas sp.]MBX9893835.1 MgtC/SapB family protein [Nitrosomonas sp.]
MHTEFTLNGELAALPHFMTSLAIGLLIGLERERSPGSRAGLRTFALVALFGTLAAMLSEKATPWLLLGGLLIVGLMMVAAYYRVKEDSVDPGTTTIAAALVCYGLGAAVWYDSDTLAIMLAIITTVLLYFKAELHGITAKLSRRDLISALQFAVLTFIILPVLPDKNLGPYEAINPHQIWLMVVLISGVSLAGYVAMQLIGQRHGAILGLFGGLVSSTATTLVYARRSMENQDFTQLAVVVILIANLTVLIRLAILSAVVSPGILPQLLPVLGSGFLCGACVTGYWWYRLNQQQEVPVPEIKNPTEIRVAAAFGLIYGIVLLCSAWLSDVAGSGGLYAVALISGLTDVDAITLSSLRLFDLGKREAIHAIVAISLAFLSNTGFKLGMIFFIGNTALARQCVSGMLATAAGVGVALLWMI